ncbi:MAG TPA: LLM class flavin-dependent oxidoreductase [Acidimicrobiales bacterium]|nr:LLM class flavin-dependent oxidoreductase [Acidimicrobiales bacterium]
MDRRPPLSARSISLRIYPHTGLGADAIVAEMRAQATLAAEAGFDGVMTSEHHGGFAGYMPNPLQAAGWLLESMPAGWAAPCPLLLPLRPPALVAEEVAWLAARFPGRVGVGVAAGSLVDDFEIMGLTKQNLTDRFAEGLDLLAGALGGGEPGRLAADPAVARCAAHPVPMASAAMSTVAVRRAAGHGMGIVFDSLSAPERVRRLVDVYRGAGGEQACILIRRVWMGTPPTDEMHRQVDVYRGYADAGAQTHWTADELVAGADAPAVADALVDVMARAGADACNLRLHAPGIAPHRVRGQIAALADVVARLRTRLGAGQAMQRNGRPPL